MTTAIIFTYLLIAVSAARPIAGHIAWAWYKQEKQEYPTLTRHTKPNGDQWCAAACLALLAVTVWPLAVTVWPLALAWHLSGRPQWRSVQEREAVVQAQEKRIKELEQELDLV